MFSTIRAKILGGLGITLLLAIAGIFLWGTSWKADALSWRAKHRVKVEEAGKVLASIRIASDNPGLKWADAADQVEAVGESRRQWRGTAKLQSQRIDEIGMETMRLKALNADLRKKADVQIAKRDAAIARLEDRALTPGDRSDCARQLREAEVALDLVWQEGL